MMWRISGLAVVLCVVRKGLGETGCPDAEEVLPCVCNTSPFAILLCQNLTDADDLRNVFSNSERYTYQEVHLQYSLMQYLPHNMFDSVEVHVIHLKNVTLTNLFDKPPNALDNLRTLFIENCKVSRGIFWKILEPLKGLKILNIYYNSIPTLGEDFSKYVAVELEQLSVYATETKTIKPGVLSNFTKLDKIAIDAGKIEILTRDIFPNPFNGRFLYFNDNKIASIPEGLFTSMPNLQTVSLRNNQIATLPEKAFDGRDHFAKIQNFILTDNPIKCDCLLVWIVPFKAGNLQGTCVYPKWNAGKTLKDLQTGDFNC